jgi:predicted ATPase
VWLVWVLWILGYPDQALQRSQEALALAREIGHSPSLGVALAFSVSHFYILAPDSQAAHEQVETLMRLATDEGLAPLHAFGEVIQGWMQVRRGQVEKGIAHMRRGITAWEATGTQAGRSLHRGLLSQAYGRSGQAERGLIVVDESLALMEQKDVRCREAEHLRIKGELLLLRGEAHAEVEAEACYHKAIEVARRQQARSWELQAAMSLCRLWQRQGKREEARQLLAGIYGWFTEGFDMPDLKDAGELLEELAT